MEISIFHENQISFFSWPLLPQLLAIRQTSSAWKHTLISGIHTRGGSMWMCWVFREQGSNKQVSLWKPPSSTSWKYTDGLRGFNYKSEGKANINWHVWICFLPDYSARQEINFLSLNIFLNVSDRESLIRFSLGNVLAGAEFNSFLSL